MGWVDRWAKWASKSGFRFWASLVALYGITAIVCALMILGAAVLVTPASWWM